MAFGDEINDYSPGYGRRMVQDMLRKALEGDEPVGPVRAEVQQGLGEQAAGYATKGLGHLGDLLDIPGAFVRGIVGAGLSAAQGEWGRAGERLLSALPGSEEIPQALGLGQGVRAPTGSDLLQDLGADTGRTMDDERRIRIAMTTGLSRSEAISRFTTKYEEEALSAAQQADFANILQQALANDPHLKQGVTSDDIKRATDAGDFLGFAAEIALDPLTYATFGASAAGKAAKLVQASSRAARFAKFAEGGIEGARLAERAILDGFKAANTFDDAARFAHGLNLPDVERSNLLNALGDAFKDGKPDLELGATLMEQVQRGQFKAGFKLPFTDQVMLEDGATRAVELVGNGIAAVGRGAMNIRPVAEFVAKHPSITGMPRRAWLRLSGEARKADVLGNDALSEIFLHEQHFNRTAGYEALRWQADLKRNVARILNDLTDAGRAEVLAKAPGLAERPERIPAAIAGMADKQTADALAEYAKLLRSSDDELLAMQQKWGLGVHELVEEFQHVGRQYSPDVLKLFSESPDARKAWLGTKTRLESDGMAQALLDSERGRKLKGMDWAESEAHMREVLKPFGLTDDMAVWDDPVQTMLKRSEKSLEAAKLRNLAHVAAEVYGLTPEGAVDLARNVVREAVAETGASAARKAEIAQELLAEARLTQEEFRAGRKALRSAVPTAERQRGEMGLAGARATEARIVTAEAQVGSRAAYQAGRDAEQKAVVAAEALRDEAKSLVSSTPGAAEAREALKQARKMLAAAKTSSDTQTAAARIAAAFGFDLAPGAAHDAVDAAKQAVKVVEDHIASNPAIKDADSALRMANAILADARETAARVETFQLAEHIDDLMASAEAAVGVKGIGASYIPQAMRRELSKAKKVIDEVVSYYKAKDTIASGAKRTPEAEAAWNVIKTAKNKGVRDVRAALSAARAELRKDAPAALVKVFDRAERQAAKVSEALSDALGAVNKPVALAVNREVRAAEKKAKLANEMLVKADINTWSPEAKAQYVAKALEKAGMAPPRGQISALELMQKARVQLPDNLEDIAALGVKHLDEAGGAEFMKYATNHYWKHLDTPGKVAKVWQAIKGVYQRATLARVSSLTRDLIGTTSQGILSGNHGYMEQARKAIGTLDDWRKGVNQADDVLMLKAAGVLRTTRGEALAREGVLAKAPLLGKVEESGVIGGTLRSLGAEKAGKAVGEKLGVLNETRAYWEELNRVATFRKAVAEGMSTDDAIGEVFKFWGNFSEMSRMERKYLNNALLFWSWMVRSVPVSLRTMAAHPAKARLALTLLAGNIGNSDAMPEWMRRMGGWMIGQDENGNYTTINLGNSTYFSPTMSGLQSDFVKELTRGNFGRAGGEALREVARSAPPLATALYERMTERESFSNEDWFKDERNRIGSNFKAPAGFYWLAGTALGNWLGVKVTSEPTMAGPKIRQVYMDPEKAQFLALIPGLEPLMQDVSSFVDPRKHTGGISPLKGLARTAGVPVYDVGVDEELVRDAKQFRRLLSESIDKLPGKALASNGVNVYPDTTTERGREMRLAMDKLYKQARGRTLDEGAARAWMYDQMSAVWPEETRWLRLNDRLRMMEKASKQPEEARLKSLVR